MNDLSNTDHKRFFKRSFGLLAVIFFLISCSSQTKNSLTPEEAKNIAKEAYIYGFPMVMNYKTINAYVLDKSSPEYKGEFNQIACEARLYTPEDKAVVTPNSDTPYCMIWADIRNEPIVITVPEMEPERFYHFQLIDLYTHNFAYLGTLTTGNQAGKYMIATSSWNGEKPEGINDILRCETGFFFTVVRTQLLNPEDIDKVKVLQSSYQIQPLSEYLGEETPTQERNQHLPKWVEGDQFNTNAFNYMDIMLYVIEPVDEEKPLIEKFAKIGLGTEGGFDITRFDPEIQAAMEEGVKEGFAEIEQFIKNNSKDPLISAKIFGTRDFLTQSAKENYGFENLYLLRAAAAHLGLYGNSGAEAVYPTYLADADGQPLNGSENKYTITFEPESLPPVKAFWSVTMYDGKTQLLINNPINRYLVNSGMMDDFVLGEDGSLTIYVQKDAPEKALESNWLPAPDGPFYCVMRLYGPKAKVLSGDWVNPPMVLSD